MNLNRISAPTVICFLKNKIRHHLNPTNQFLLPPASMTGQNSRESMLCAYRHTGADPLAVVSKKVLAGNNRDPLKSTLYKDFVVIRFESFSW